METKHILFYGSLLLLFIIALIMYSNMENFDDLSQYATLAPVINWVTQPPADVSMPSESNPVVSSPMDTISVQQSVSLTPEDLLPSDKALNQFENQFPSGAGDVAGNNFLIAGQNIGIDTISSSLKNANQQIRSDPYIPRVSVSPWNESTILPSDIINRKQFEIGSGPCM